MHSVKGEDAAPPRTEAALPGTALPRTARLVAGRYRLEQPIGRGAMGTVWRGRDVLLDRDVAIKEVRSCGLATPAESQDAYLRTLREAKAAARLNHPAAVTVFDVFEEHGTPWIVMELVSARSLDRLVAEDGPLRPREAARLGEHLLSALACAHAAGVLHRDVKPGNVLVRGGAGAVGTGTVTAVLTDFGIATMAGDPALTQVGMVFGTPGFTAPERLHGDPATPASDLWSLGATLYMAVEGRGPFERPGGSAAIIAGVAREPAPRAPSAGPLGPVIDALLQADPARRPDAATAARMLAEASAGPDRPGPAGLPDGRGDLGGLAESSPRGQWRGGLGGSSPRGQHGAGWPSPVGTPRFSDQPDAGPRSFLDAPSLLDQPEFLYQSGLLNPPGTSTAGPPRGVPDDAAPGFSPPRQRGRRGRGRGGLRGRGGRGRTAAITAVAVIAAGLAGYAAYPRPADLDVTSPPAAQGQTPGTGTGTGSNAPRGSQPTGRDTASPAGSGPAPSGTGQSTASGSGGAAGASGAAGGSGAAGAPAGYRWYQVSAAASGTVAGFEIAVPDTWQASQPGPDNILRSPDSGAFIEVSLAPFRYTRPLREAEFRQAQAIRRDPGYHLTGTATGTFLGAADAVWEFSSQDAGTRVSVEELLVTVDTTAGAQPYAIAVSAPSASFGPALAVFRQALATFQPVP